MDTKNYFSAINKVHAMPVGLGAYLSQVITEKHFDRHQKTGAGDTGPMYLANIQKGSARLYSLDQETHRQHTHEFFLPGDFLPLPAGFDQIKKEGLFIEFLEDSTVFAISEKHFRYIPKLFTTCTILYQKLHYIHFLAQLDRNLYREDSAGERFKKLMHTRPSLLNLAAVKDLASYLGIHPNTLSMLKGKK